MVRMHHEGQGPGKDGVDFGGRQHLGIKQKY